MEWETFKNPPIIECLLDIRVSLPVESDLLELEKIETYTKSNFTTKRKIEEWQTDLKIKDGIPEPSQTSGKQIGYQFISNDKKIVQVRLNGFTFHKLKPYESWEKLRDEAKKLWENYKEVAKPKSVTRIALRYINRLELPLPFKDFKEYIMTIPEMAPEVPQGLSSYFMRLVIPDPDSQSVGIVTEVMEPVVQGKEILTIIFDIDVFQEKILEPESAEIWSILEALRNLKNRIFFKSITPKTEELFR